MIRVAVDRWAAWAPGLEDPDAWRAWCRDPKELERSGKPDVSFLPAMLRRRCGPLARIMLNAAFQCSEGSDRASLGNVFASRHGNINESIDLLERLARKQPLSPTKFSHTVHNAQAGLFSIAAASHAASTSVAAQEDTFACGFIEALTLLRRRPSEPVMLVIGDAPLEEPFASLVDEPEAFYALALQLSVEPTQASPTLGFSIESGEARTQRLRWPAACEFLRWLLGDEAQLVLPASASSTRHYTWTR